MRFEQRHNRLFCGHKRLKRTGATRREAGFVLTFAEVLVSVVIVAVVFGTIISGYLMGAVKTQWSGYSLAAQSLAVQTLEQARAAAWDGQLKTEVTNMNLSGKSIISSFGGYTMTGYTTNIMDIPWKGNNYVVATNWVTVQQIYADGITNPAVYLQVVRVDTVWPFSGWGKFSLANYTNSVCTYIAPDNRDPSTLGVGN